MNIRLKDGFNRTQSYEQTNKQQIFCHHYLYCKSSVKVLTLAVNVEVRLIVAYSLSNQTV